MELAQALHVSVEIVVIGAEYACCACNSCSWPSLCVFQLGLLQLAQTMCISVEIASSGSDSVHFSLGSYHWFRLSLQLSQNICVSLEIVVIG